MLESEGFDVEHIYESKTNKRQFTQDPVKSQRLDYLCTKK